MSLESFTHPESLTAGATHIKEGYVMGCVPGIITSVNDLELLGRISVKVDLIDSTTNLPTEAQGYAWVTEDYVCANQPGGSHRLLTTDSQCFLIPILGLPTQWVLIGCVNSRVEPPSPELNRLNGLHGSATPNGVQKISDDRDQSQVHAFPHGVTQLVSAKGDAVQQTAGGARSSLSHDGEVRHENSSSFSQLTPQGDVISQSKDGARSILSQDGNAIFTSAFQAALQLLKQESKLTGPPDPISAALKILKSGMSGQLGVAQQVLKQLNQVTQQLNKGGLLASAITQVEPLIKKLEGLGGAIAPGLEAFKTLQRAAPAQLGALVEKQISTALKLNLHELIPQIEKLVKQDSPDLVKSLEQMFQKPLNAAIGNTIAGLKYDPKLQVQAILGEFLPEGFEQIKTLVGLDLADKVQPLQTLLQQMPIDEDNSDRYESLLRQQVQQVQALLPVEIQKLIKPDFLRGLIQGGEVNPVQALIGQVQHRMIEKAQAIFKEVQPAMGAIAPIQGLMQAIREGTPTAAAIGSLAKLPGFKGLADATNPEGLIKSALAGISKRLQPLFEKGMGQLNQMLNSIPGDANRAVLKLQQNISTLSAGELGPSATMQVTRLAAELISPDKTNRLFAGVAGAGIKTPHGKFSIGAAGGSMFFPQGQMAMIAAGAGLLLGKKGVSLSGLSGVGIDPKDEDRVIWANETARINVQGNTIRLQSFGGGEHHELTVSPEGVAINGYVVSHLFDLFDRFSLLEQRLATIEAGIVPPIV